MDAKILNEILAPRNLQYIKTFIHHDRVGSIPGLQGWFDIRKSINVIEQIKKWKLENHMVLSIDEEKTLDIIQHLSLTKKLQSIGIEGIFVNFIKCFYEKPAVNTILKG